MVIRIITGCPSLTPSKPKMKKEKKRKEKKHKGHMKLNGKIHYQSRCYCFSFALIDCMGYNFIFAIVVFKDYVVPSQNSRSRIQ